MSQRWPTFTSAQLIRALRKLGFSISPGGKGSHVKLTHPNYRGALTIPRSKTLGTGIRRAMLKQIKAMGVDLTELRRKL